LGIETPRLNIENDNRKRQPKKPEITRNHKKKKGRREFTNELRNCTTAITIPLKAQSEPRGKAIEAAGRE
jgi:hypothetical protein